MAIPQAQAEQGYVVDFAGWWLLAVFAVLFFAWVVASWRARTDERNRRRVRRARMAPYIRLARRKTTR